MEGATRRWPSRSEDESGLFPHRKNTPAVDHGQYADGWQVFLGVRLGKKGRFNIQSLRVLSLRLPIRKSSRRGHFGWKSVYVQDRNWPAYSVRGTRWGQAEENRKFCPLRKDSRASVAFRYFWSRRSSPFAVLLMPVQHPWRLVA